MEFTDLISILFRGLSPCLAVVRVVIEFMPETQISPEITT